MASINGNPIVECVPNFSEGRDSAVMEKIVEPFRRTRTVRLLDYQKDEDHNRMVVTAIGEPRFLKSAVLDAMEQAVALIDMNLHRGQHPRMGAMDVAPLVPVARVTMEEVVTLSEELAEEIAARFQVPVFLYERSARRPERKDLAAIRKGEFEGLGQKLKQPDWQPDYGPSRPHPTAGAVAVGARSPLIAFNVNLHTNDLDIARRIAARVRHSGGGLRYCKAMGVELKQRGMVQVSMNLTDFTQTAIYRALELVRVEAGRYGVPVAGSEIVGLVPMAALVDCAMYYLGIEGFPMDRILETHLMN
ncbi:MAG: glutamate formimidoyltransferase [Thermodesulfobacteriota bacterium]